MAAENVASQVSETGELLPVSREVWAIAEHVALPLKDPGHYWDAVRRVVDISPRKREAET